MCYCPISDFLDLACIAGEYGGVQKLYGNTKNKWKPSSNVTTCQRHDVPTSRRANVTAFQRRRNVATSSQQKKKSKSDPTSQCSCNSYFIIIKSTGDLIFEIIEGRMDEERRTKLQQPKRSKRLCFCIPLLKTINDLYNYACIKFLYVLELFLGFC